jgi:hypothetical protein
MWSENLDKKIKEAAEQHHPSYDEKAWQKMAKLLDKHLPQEENDKRRFIFFLLLFLFLGGGGIYLFMNKPWQKKSVSNSVSTKNIGDNSENKNNNNSSTVNIKNDNSNSVTIPGKKSSGLIKDDAEKLLARSTGKIKEHKNAIVAEEFVKQSNNSLLITNSKYRSEDNISHSISKTNTLLLQNNRIDRADEFQNSSNNFSISSFANHVTGINIDLPAKKENQEIKKSDDNANSKTSNKRIKNSEKNNGFALLISAGPDVSKAGSSSMGKMTLTYGGGIAFTKNRFTLRTGVFMARKIYTANSEDYTLSYTPPPTAKFEKADANCKVLEIPVNLSYNFASKGNANWFASAGLSSYLMKQESYNYLYKYNYGGYYNRQYDVKNKNNHYFSVLDLSAGYTRRINNTLSVTVEPYVKIPLKGIGEGEVHLNSGGVLFTLGIKPFHHSIKKN